MANTGLGSLDDGAEVSVKAPTAKGMPSIVGNVALDATETKNILDSMQKMVEERSGPMATFLGGLKDATAWTSGGAQGPSAALAERDRQKLIEQQDISSMQSQMAMYRAAQRQAENDAARLTNWTGGGAGTGAGMPGTADLTPEAQARVKNARNPTEALAIINEDLKATAAARSKGRFEAAGNKSEKYFINGQWVDMTPNMLANMPAALKQQIEMETYKRLGYVPGQQTAPATGTAAAPSAASPTGDAAARVAANESGANPNIGYHDLSKSSAYGTYGITKGAYQDIQAANPKFKDRPITSLTPAEQTEAFNTYRQLSGNRLSQLGVETNQQNLDLAHFLGADGAARFLKTGQISDAAAAANGGKEKATAIAQSLLGGKQTAVSPAAGQQTLPGLPHPSTLVAPKPIINEWDDNTKMLPENEWDDNTKMLPGHAAPAAAPAAVPAPAGTAAMPTGATTSSITDFNEPRPSTVKRFASSYDAEKADADWEKRRDAHIAAAVKFQEQVGGESAKAFADTEKAFVDNTDQTQLANRERNTEQLDAWMKRWGESPRILEILSKPTFANAVADALQQGVNLSAAGNLSIPGIERIIQSSMPGLKGEEVTALKELSSIMGPRIFQIVKQSKGSSSDKDWAAFTQIAGNSSTGYDFLNKAVKYDRASLKADRADRDLYNSLQKPGQPTDYRGFAAHPKRNEIYTEYNNAVKNIAAMKHERQQLPPRPAGMPKDVPAKWSPSTGSYWIGNTEYKVK